MVEVPEDRAGGRGIRGFAPLAMAALLAWSPAETHPWSFPIASAVALAVLLGDRRRVAAGAAAAWLALSAALLVIPHGLLGYDPSAALTEGTLLVAVAAVVWLASRQAPPEPAGAVFGLVVAGLAVWGLLQVTAGPEHHAAVLQQVPEQFRSDAAERLAAGRAFASQPLPSHLAVLLATGLPLLLARVRRDRAAVLWGGGALLCVAGLAATRSPVGLGLALAAAAALAAARHRRAALPLAVALAAALAIVIVVRGDVRELEPVGLRLDNWRSAVWIWSTAPAAGIGFGGFGQAAQAVPFEVGNRPRHAHSLPLEWLAELGPVGLAAALAIAIWLSGLVRDLWPLRPDLAVAVAVIPAHNLVDFSLYGSGVAVPWAVLAGWAVACRRSEVRDPPVRRGRPLLIAAAVATLAVSCLHAASRSLDPPAVSDLPAGDRFELASRAARVAPWRVGPATAMAVAALDSGDLDRIAAAAVALDEIRWLKPRAASIADLRGLLAEAEGDAPRALSEAWEAARANPSNPVYRQRYERLLGRLHGPR